MASLNSVQCKIFRAVQHIKSLEPELKAYFESNPGGMVRQPGTADNEAIFRFAAKGPVPARFGLIVGDCLQNLRSSLDYLVWELALSAGNQPNDRNMFPICSSPEYFDAQLKRHRLDGVPADAIAEIERLEPYHLGQDFNKRILWAIDELTNINKHRRILLTNLMAERAKQENVVTKEGVLWYSYDTGPGPTPIFDSKTEFGPFPIIDGKIHMDTAPFIVVMAFDEGPAKGMEICLCMNKWASYILTDLLPAFEKFFV
jgi:hypothetical protein